MITLNIDSLLAGREFVKKKKREVVDSRDRQYRHIVLNMYRSFLGVLPQFSGDMVSNADIETLNSPGRSYQMWPEKTGFNKDGSVRDMGAEPRHAGEGSPALMSAYMRGVQRMRYVKYGEPVYFVNPTPLKIESPYVVGPDSVELLREQPVIDAWASISSYLQAKHGSPP